MSGSYNFIDHTADIAVEVNADSVEELFNSAARAFKETVIGSTSISNEENFTLRLSSHSLEALLVNFLNELNFRLISMNKIFNSINKMKILQIDNKYSLECVLVEEGITEDKIKTEIKSVTYYMMEIRNINGIYSTKITFDI